MASDTPTILRQLYNHKREGSTFIISEKEDSEVSTYGAFTVLEYEHIITPHLSILYDKVDLFMTINSFFCPEKILAKNKGKIIPFIPNSFKEKNLTHLNAVYIDVDCGRYEEGKKHHNSMLSVFEAETEIRKLAELGEIPKPSVFIRSGQGMWALWLLEADEQPYHRRRMAERLAIYKSVNKALQQKFPSLPVDSICDASRIIRYPNSINSKSHASVSWSLQGDEQGVYRYNLEELAQRLSVSNQKATPRKSIISFKAKDNKTGDKGFKILNENRLNDLSILFENKMIYEGYRRFALTEIAKHLRALRIHGEEFEKCLKRYSKLTLPPYPEDELENIITSYGKLNPADFIANGQDANVPFSRDETIVKKLNINRASAEALGLVQLIPQSLKEERKMKASKAWMIKERREALEKLVSINPNARHVDLATQLECSSKTIQRDLKVLEKR